MSVEGSEPVGLGKNGELIDGSGNVIDLGGNVGNVVKLQAGVNTGGDGDQMNVALVTGGTIQLRAGPTGSIILLSGNDGGDPTVAVTCMDTGDFIISSAGLGFFGNGTPAPKQNVPLTTPDVQDVIDALVAYGLITQSDA